LDSGRPGMRASVSSCHDVISLPCHDSGRTKKLHSGINDLGEGYVRAGGQANQASSTLWPNIFLERTIAAKKGGVFSLPGSLSLSLCWPGGVIENLLNSIRTGLGKG
jgi:hypothetical protein